MPVCDGCGAVVDDAHIHRRIVRLEQATRFRPIHIQFLLIDSAPPADPADFFYQTGAASEERSVAARMYFAELTKLGEVKPGSDISDEAALTEFQRRGCFLAHAVECPVENEEQLIAAIGLLSPTMVLRVRTSYKPKRIILLSQPTEELIKPLRDAELGDLLVLDGDAPFVDPFLGDPQNQAEFDTSLGDRLVRAVSHLAL